MRKIIWCAIFVTVGMPGHAQTLDGDWTCRSGLALLGRLIVSGDDYGMQTSDGSVFEGKLLNRSSTPVPISGGLLSLGIDGFWPYQSTDDRGSYPTLDLTSQGVTVAICLETE